MVIFKNAVPRRMFLRGMGSTLALPLLDAMIPALGRADTAKAPVRLGIVYVPNGMWPMNRWTPNADGAAFELTPTLAPLAPFRDQLVVVSGLAHKEAMSTPEDPSGPHAHACSSYQIGRAHV